MNKLLPILLVVVLSGCSFFSSEYACRSLGKNDYGHYLKITSSEIIQESKNYTDTYKIDSETSNKISASFISSAGVKYIAEFDKRLLRLHITGYISDNEYSHISTKECREL